MSQKNVAKPPDDALPTEAGKALFRLGRFLNKQALPEALKRRTAGGVELSQILTVQAVEAVLEARQEATVGAVAQSFGLEPSTASRMVAEAVQHGLLARGASQADGRRSLLELTPAGRTLAANAADYQRSVFESVTDSWADEEREEFTRLFVVFVKRLASAPVSESRKETK